MLTIINTTGMALLLVWSILNISLGFIKTRNEVKKSEKYYFWQMNLYWNSVNAVIAILALASFFPKIGNAPSAAEISSTIQILGFNSFLDIIYMLVGLALVKKSAKNGSTLLSGYGKSIQIQGAFLLILDVLLLSTNMYFSLQLQ